MGKHTLIGYVQFDLAKFINCENQKAEFDLQKSKIKTETTIVINVTVKDPKEMKDLDNFNSELEKQGNLEAGAIPIDPNEL